MALRPLAAQHLPCRQLTGPSIRHQWHVCRAAATQAAYTPKEAVETLQKLLKQSVLSNAKVQPRSYSDLLGERVGLIAKQDISANEDSSNSPLMWEESEVTKLLAGSPTQAEARTRAAELRQQWQALSEGWLAKDSKTFSPAVYNEKAFLQAFGVVIANSVYLSAAQCFALMPLASTMGRTGNDNGCNLDYDSELGAVVITAPLRMIEGQELLLNDGRPNGEMLLSTGTVQENNKSDFLLFPTSLVPADRYYTMKSEILESVGLAPKELFPVFADRFPNQMLSYLRLARVQDPGLFAKVSFDVDNELSQVNEYEILQLLMGDCRERLAAYAGSYEEDMKMLQQLDLTPRERLANKLRLGEKKVLSKTMDAMRKRLAPIRGIPTKQGNLTDPNSDLKEIFEFVEGIPSAPMRLLDGVLSWARGEDDPDWKKKGGAKPGQKRK